jgi:ribosomal protein S18 acetylase RimI-like enzyme
VAVVTPVARSTRVDAATVRALERHETAAHAIPAREVRDLGDSIVLYDPRNSDPFWNRMASVRWPSDPGAFDHRLAQALAMFAVMGRQPHIWPSPDHNRPVDLTARLEAHGFQDAGSGHLMVLVDPGSCPPVQPGDPAPGLTLHGIRRAADAERADLDDVASVLAESFGALPGRAVELASDLRRTLDDPRVSLVLARVDGEPAAAAKATTFDGFTYLSSVGARPAFRGRGLGALVTRHAIAIAGGHASRLVYLGVFDGNEPALRLYERLGFASIGCAPDLLLE